MNEITENSVVVSKWGYDQTNVDFYQVTKISGDFAYLQELKQSTSSDFSGFMTGQALPKVNEFSGDKIIRRKIHKNDNYPDYIKIESFMWANLWDGRPEHFSTHA